MFDRNLTYQSFTNPLLAGKFGDYDFSSNPYVDFSQIETEDKDKTNKKELSPIEQLFYRMYDDSQKEKRYFRSKEYLDDMYERADRLQAQQMARAQKYGKESAFYGFMYQGLPKLMAQAAFSRYAFAPEMVKGVQDAYSRINLAGAVKPHGGQSYMSINPMGGIG